MTETAEKLRSELQTLAPAERAELAHFLIRSLEGTHEDTEAESEWDRKLARRAEEIRSGREKGEPAEEVFARLRAKAAPGLGKATLIVGLILASVHMALAVDPDPFQFRAVTKTANEHTQAYAISWHDPSSETVLLDEATLLDHTAVDNASLEHNEQGQPFIHIKLTPEGGKRWGEISTKYVNQRIGIMLDGRLSSAPVIKEPMFGGDLNLSGNFTEAEAVDLVTKINRSVSR